VRYTQGSYPIVSKKRVSDRVYDFTLHCPEIAVAAVPGQFAGIAAPGFTLRRPVSLAGIDPAAGTLRLIIEVRGRGTDAISRLEEGASADILAPLGRGFDLNYDTAVIVCGGIGAPPMLPVAKKFGKNCSVVSGFRGSSSVILQDEFAAAGAATVLSTDDGSAGKKGLVTDALPPLLEEKTPDIVYACGPRKMLQAVVRLSNEYGIRCQVSLEERMCCGIGACLVCACEVLDGEGQRYARVCADGPVFWGSEVVFDECHE
jgi:dihydroorotate dehydrogenase electron transfer subunit